jgi:ribosomal protein L12E/L44/L45/RPP1/RPP2
MSDLLTRNVSPKIHEKLKKLAAKKGLSVQQVTVKALESYLQASEIEERLEQISNRLGVSIDPADISQIITEERSKRP